MTMRPLDKTSYEEWDRFVARANGTIFHNAWWYNSWGGDFEIYARRDKNGDIEAGMPVYISKLKQMPRFFGVKGVTKPPFTPVNGPLFLCSAKAGRCSGYTHVKKEVMSAISSLPKAGFYDIFLGGLQYDLMPYIWNGFDTQVYYTYVIPKENAGTWRNNMSANARRNLKAAHKEAGALGCTLEVDPALNEITPIIFETAESNGFSMQRIAGLLPGWWETVKERGAGRTYVLRDGTGAALCASLVVWDTRSVYFMAGGMSGKARKEGHLNMILFERMIMDSFAMGLDFDFEGSTLRGVEGFFRGWGGELRPCYRVTKIPSTFAYLGWRGLMYLKFHRKRRWVESPELGM